MEEVNFLKRKSTDSHTYAWSTSHTILLVFAGVVDDVNLKWLWHMAEPSQHAHHVLWLGGLSGCGGLEKVGVHSVHTLWC